MHPRFDPSNSREPNPLGRLLGDLFEQLLSDAEVVSRPSLLLLQPVEAHQVFYPFVVFHAFFLLFYPCGVALPLPYRRTHDATLRSPVPSPRPASTAAASVAECPISGLS